MKKANNCNQVEVKSNQVLSLAIDLICIISFDGYFKYLNPAWTKTLFWSVEELRAKPFIEFIHSEDRDATILENQKLVTGIDTIGFENRFLCQTGSYKWLSWNATASSEEQLVYAVARDMTSHKESEIALQHYVKELEALKFALNAHSLVAITDIKGIITYANDKFCEVSKYSIEELLGQDHRIINSGDHSKEFFENLWKTIAQGKTWKGEIKNKAKDGTFYWVDTLIVPFLNHNGKPYQYVAIRTDITERKLSDLALLERSRLSLMSAEVSLALSQSGTLSETLQHCTNIISHYLEVTFICIWTLERQTKQLQLQAGVHCIDAICNVLSDTKAFPDHMVVANSIVSLMIQNHQAIVNEEVQIKNEEKLLEPTLSNVRFSAYPLIVEKELIGMMVLFNQQLFTEPTHNLLNWIANNIAVAIDRVWAREELFSRREALLLRLATQIRKSLDLDTILETAVNEIRCLLQIDRCYFLQDLQNTLQPTLTITHESRNSNLPTLLGDIPLQKSTFLTKTVLTQEVICIEDINSKFNLNNDMQELLTELGITAQLLLPVKNNSGRFGAIVCSHCSGERVWSNSEIGLLEAVTAQLAIAIDHAQLYNHSQAVALAAQTHADKLSEALQKLQNTQAQLIQQEKMSSLGQLVAGVAHEINNPVNFIHGNLTHAHDYTQDLLELLHLYQQVYPNPNPEIQTFCEAIDLEFITDDLSKLLSSMKMGTNRIREIVLSLRNFSRLDEAEKKSVDIHEGIDNTLQILQHRFKETGSEMNISVIKKYGNLPLIDCYPGQLNQVFMNILTNAIDALKESLISGNLSFVEDKELMTNDPFGIHPSPVVAATRTGDACGIANPALTQLPRSGNPPQNCEQDRKGQMTSPQIRIHTEVLDSNFVVIRIADNGAGITEAVRTRLFDPFFTTKPVGKGTGLGLSISYQIVVEKHGGSLKCLSQPGQGTEFWIQIPLKLTW